MKKTSTNKSKKASEKRDNSVAPSVPKNPKKDEQREERIVMEIIVDANGPEEQGMGWYYYLEEKLRYPFLRDFGHTSSSDSAHSRG